MRETPSPPAGDSVDGDDVLGADRAARCVRAARHVAVAEQARRHELPVALARWFDLEDARRAEELAALRAQLAEALRYCPAMGRCDACGWRVRAPVYYRRSHYVPGWSGLDGDVCAGVPAYLAARSLPAARRSARRPAAVSIARDAVM